jgi:hypothetical protein
MDVSGCSEVGSRHGARNARWLGEARQGTRMFGAWLTKTVTNVGQNGCGSEKQRRTTKRNKTVGRGMRLCAGRRKMRGRVGLAGEWVVCTELRKRAGLLAIRNLEQTSRCGGGLCSRTLYCTVPWWVGTSRRPGLSSRGLATQDDKTGSPRAALTASVQALGASSWPPIWLD